MLVLKRLCQIIFFLNVYQGSMMVKGLSPLATGSLANIYRLRYASINHTGNASCRTTADCAQSKCCLNGRCSNKGRAFDNCYASMEKSIAPSQQDALTDLCPCQSPYVCLSFNREQVHPRFGSLGFCIPPL